MSDSTVTSRPSTDVALAGWSLVGGGGTAHATLSDDSGSTYVEGSGSAGGTLRVGMAALALGPYDQLHYVRPWVKAASPTPGRVLAVRLYGLGVHQLTAEQKVTLSATPTRYDLLPYQGWPTGRAFSAADLAGLLLALRDTTSPAGDIRVHEAGVDVVYNGAPTAVITAPAAVVADSCLVTPTWLYSDPEGDEQGRYQLRVYVRPVGGWPVVVSGGNDAEVASLEAANVRPVASVEEIGDLTFAAPVLMPPIADARLYLRVSDQGSNSRYGSWAKQPFVMGVDSPPGSPTLVATPDPTRASVRLDLAPTAGTIDFYEVQRSIDSGATWDSVFGLRPEVAFVSSSANVLDDAAFASDSNADGMADDWSLYSTGGGDPAPTASLIAGISGGSAQRIAWTTNTGRKGLSTVPRVGADSDDTWVASSEWLLSFEYASDFADASMLPVAGFDVGGFTVTWFEQPTPTTGFQRYTALITAPGADAVSALYLYSTGGANHRFDVAQPQLVPVAALAHAGIGVPPIGTEPLGGPAGPATVTDPLTPPQWSARESVSAAVYDRTAPRCVGLLYRARVVARYGSGTAFGTIEKASAWTTTAAIVLVSDGNAWLHSSSDGGLDAAFCQAGVTMTATSDEDQAAYYAEGRAAAVVVHGTIHAERIDALMLSFGSDAERDRFAQLRALREPLLLQTLYGEGPLEQFWITIGPQVPTVRFGGYAEMNTAAVRQATFAAIGVAEPA